MKLFNEMKKIRNILTWAATTSALSFLMILVLKRFSPKNMVAVFWEFYSNPLIQENLLFFSSLFVLLIVLFIYFLKSDAGKSVKIIVASIVVIVLVFNNIEKDDIKQIIRGMNGNTRIDTVVVYHEKEKIVYKEIAYVPAKKEVILDTVFLEPKEISISKNKKKEDVYKEVKHLDEFDSHQPIF